MLERSLVKQHFIQIKYDLVIFVMCFILYGWNELYLKEQSSIMNWFFTGYYNDILAPIILLSYSNILILIFMKKKITNFIGLSLFVMIVGLYWEYITPLYKNSTSDIYDLLAYYIGFLIYWLSTKAGDITKA
ncbi:hypothetical protein SAMN02799616_04989 [Paenibacillus sp. UNC499MF]|nr:hypothetical protein SAMN02799616_04989 [Paenibacillus sp. UNC499MF]